MCTLTVRLNSNDDYPLVVVANRDEFYARPSAPPALVSNNPAIFAPQDLEAGGTWFGINEWGLVAAVTNVWFQTQNEMQRDKQLTRSRGLLTLDALRCRNIVEIRQFLPEKIIHEHYQPFNLLVTSTTTAVVFTYTNELREYILTDRGATILNAPYRPPKATPEELPPFPAHDDNQHGLVGDWLQTIRRLLSQHPVICKHSENFGTLSAQILVMGKRSRGRREPTFPDRFWYADGPPCETDFRDLSEQLRTITQPTEKSIERM